MDKTEGVPLSQIWDTIKLPQKLQVLLAITRLQKRWLSVSFSHYGSLYYAEDVQSPAGNQPIDFGYRERAIYVEIRIIFVQPLTIPLRGFSTAYGLIFLAHRMVEYSEARFQSLLVDLKDTWADLPAVTGDTLFPFNFSDAESEKIKLGSDSAVAGTELVAEAKERLGDLYPDKGFIEHHRYDDCVATLDEIKGQILEHLAGNDEERDEYERYCPFERSHALQTNSGSREEQLWLIVDLVFLLPCTLGLLAYLMKKIS